MRVSSSDYDYICPHTTIIRLDKLKHAIQVAKLNLRGRAHSAHAQHEGLV
jgi:hypothetical protein